MEWKGRKETKRNPDQRFLIAVINGSLRLFPLSLLFRSFSMEARKERKQKEKRLGDEDRRLMHLVPAPAVRLMKRRVLSRPGVNRG